MWSKKMISAALSLVPGAFMSVEASAFNELSPKDSVHKFDIGSDEVGGSGVEEDTSSAGKAEESSSKEEKKEDDSSSSSALLFGGIGAGVLVIAAVIIAVLRKGK